MVLGLTSVEPHDRQGIEEGLPQVWLTSLTRGQPDEQRVTELLLLDDVEGRIASALWSQVTGGTWVAISSEDKERLGLPLGIPPIVSAPGHVPDRPDLRSKPGGSTPSPGA